MIQSTSPQPQPPPLQNEVQLPLLGMVQEIAHCQAVSMPEALLEVRKTWDVVGF